MAGIGFELKKLAGRGGLGAYLQVALSGAVIVAGPWLISILALFLINRLAPQSLREEFELFIAFTVYTYALSLSLTGGFQYLMTRIMSDRMYEKRDDAALGLLLKSLPLMLLFSLATGLPLYAVMSRGLAWRAAVTAAGVALYSVLNALWLVLLFSSVLRWFGRILAVFALGLAVSLVLVLLAGDSGGLLAALSGFAAGHGLILGLLLFLLRLHTRPDLSVRFGAALRAGFRQYGMLAAVGALYSAGLWADKAVFWFLRGDVIAPSGLRLYSGYDAAVYLANLVMIPGLIYFTVETETGFYVELRKFLGALLHSRYPELQRRKFFLSRRLRQGIAEQSLLQGLLCAILILNARPLLARLAPAAVPGTLALCLAGAFILLLFMTLLYAHFYLELYGAAFRGALFFFLLNMGGAFLPLPAGVSYLIGLGTGALYLAVSLRRVLRSLERYFLLKASR